MHQNCKNYTFLVLCSFILKPQSWKEYKLTYVNQNQGFENHKNTEPILAYSKGDYRVQKANINGPEMVK